MPPVDRPGRAAPAGFALILAAALTASFAAGFRAAAQSGDRPAPVGPGPATAPSLAGRQAELRNLLAEVRRERGATEAAREAWAREKAELEDEIRALDEETARLERSLPELRTRAAALETETRDAERRIRAASERATRLRAALAARLGALGDLAEQGLPLERTARANKAREAAREAARGDHPLSSAAGDLLGLAFQILADSRSFQATSAVLEDAAGGRRVVEVLRVGSVQALARTGEGGDVHTVRTDESGRPVWSPPRSDPALADFIRRGLEIVKRRRAPELLSLPVPGPATGRTDAASGTGGRESRP